MFVSATEVRGYADGVKEVPTMQNRSVTSSHHPGDPPPPPDLSATSATSATLDEAC